ncbi:MAG TPA: hypothetical protein VMW18_08800 [Candidatus Binatia bacterium]|nr:hypothetical protein [Bradyrhizobium sp.]HVM83972.1 hypothetical protein [Candidatus Binatia bacterium]
MSILTLVSMKPILALSLRSAGRPFTALGHILVGAAEMRGRAVASTYLMAMGINPNRGEERRGDY